MKITKEDTFVSVKYGYNPYYNDRIKALGGKWHPDTLSWRLPLHTYEDVESLFGLTKRHHSSNDVSLNLKSIQEDMIRLGYSNTTVVNYMCHMRLFLAYSEGQCRIEDVNAYLLDLIHHRDASHSYCNQAVSAIKIYSRKFSDLPETEIMQLQRPKREKKLPKVMSKEEVKAILDATENIKHRTELMMAYSCGLRVSEVANMKVTNIDSSRMVVMVQQSKGRKDRQSMLSETMLEQLRDYYQLYTPKEWLFENQRKNGPISPRTLQKVFNDAVWKSGIKKKVTFHSLRHSFATHLLV